MTIGTESYRWRFEILSRPRRHRRRRTNLEAPDPVAPARAKRKVVEARILRGTVDEITRTAEMGFLEDLDVAAVGIGRGQVRNARATGRAREHQR